MLDANTTNQPKHGYVVTVGVQWGLEALLDLNFWGEGATKEGITPFAYTAVTEFNQKVTALTGFHTMWNPKRSYVAIVAPANQTKGMIEAKIFKFLSLEGYGGINPLTVQECLEAVKQDVLEEALENWLSNYTSLANK